MSAVKDREKSKSHSMLLVWVTGQVTGPMTKTGTHLRQTMMDFIWTGEADEPLECCMEISGK